MTTETRKHTAIQGRATVGRAIVYITCPFCGHTCTAYLWSLAGSGKRCTKCRAKHDHYGNTTKETP